MQDLITIVENEPRVSHRVVAQNTENQQKNINELIHKYRDDIEEFGTLPFKTEGVVNGGKGDQPKTYYLNEPQATFLMTLLRNKPIVVEFKKKLVKAFYKQKDILKTKSLNTNAVNSELLVEMLKTQQLFMENQQKQTDAILELVKSIKTTPAVAQQTQQSVYLDSRDRKNLRDAIQAKAKEVAKDLGVSPSTIAPSLWIELKYFFDVDDYQDLEKSQLKDVLHFVMFWEPKAGMKKCKPDIDLPEGVKIVKI